MTTEDKIKLEIRRAKADLNYFIKLIHPDRMLGSVHEELNDWCTRSQAKSHQLVLLPRDHQKSAMAAYRVAWEITKNPAVRVLYISATSKLAVKQLKMIKDILLCDNYRRYWPEMVNEKETEREKWSETEISVDHPKRKAEYIRDPTIFTAGLTTTIVGMHCDIAVLDDVVIDDNAYTPDGRETVRRQASYLASIASTDGRMWCYGTRYHPKDLYNDFLNQNVTLYDEDTGDITESFSLYEVFERQVESRGDGTGEFLWPKQQRKDGKIFGFDQRILAIKKAQYADIGMFKAQYYNDPSSSEQSIIKPEHFSYYNRQKVEQQGGYWFYNNYRLNVFAGIDFAYSTGLKSDYTAIVVIGMNSNRDIYVLDIDRFKTNNIKEYFDRLLALHSKWDFTKLRAEVTAAQSVIVRDLKENYIKPYGLNLSIDENRPKKNKEDRIAAALNNKYLNHQIYHYKGGNCSMLEEELTQTRPAHDDIKDCLAAVIEIAVPPSRRHQDKRSTTEVYYHSRFGGIH